MAFSTRWCSRACMYDAAVAGAIMCGGLNMGLNLGLIGPTLPDLAQYTGVSITIMSTLVTWRSMAFIIGSLVSGILLEYVEGFLCISIVLFLQAVTTALSPWSRNFVAFSILQAFASFFSTIVITGTTFLCFKLETSKAQVLSQATFLLFNIGKTVVPFIVGPFLSGNTTTKTTTATTVQPPSTPSHFTIISNSSTYPNWAVTGTNVTVGKTHVGWAYVIVGAFCLLMSILYFAIAVVNGCALRAEKKLQNDSDETDSPPKPEVPLPFSRYRFIYIVTVFCLIVFFQSCIEFMDGNLLMTQVTVFMHRTKLMGLAVTAVYQGIKIIVCIGTVLLIKRIHASVFLITDSVFMLIGTCVMTVGITFNQDYLFWIGIVGLGIGMANFYATLFSWLRLYAPVSGRLSSLATLAFGVGGMGLPPLATWLLNKYGAIVFPACQLVLTCICTALVFLLKLGFKESCCPQPSIHAIATSSSVKKEENSPLVKDQDNVPSYSHSNG